MLPPILSPAFEILKEDVLSTRAQWGPCYSHPSSLGTGHTTLKGYKGRQDASAHGLDRMPNIDPAVAALVLTPGEALRPDARGPRPQCRLTDDYIVKSYDTAARIGGLGNSMSHLILALSQTLQAFE